MFALTPHRHWDIVDPEPSVCDTVAIVIHDEAVRDPSVGRIMVRWRARHPDLQARSPAERHHVDVSPGGDLGSRVVRWVEISAQLEDLAATLFVYWNDVQEDRLDARAADGLGADGRGPVLLRTCRGPGQ
jgi:hypothetical protein